MIYVTISRGDRCFLLFFFPSDGMRENEIQWSSNSTKKDPPPQKKKTATFLSLEYIVPLHLLPNLFKKKEDGHAKEYIYA